MNSSIHPSLYRPIRRLTLAKPRRRGDLVSIFESLDIDFAHPRRGRLEAADVRRLQAERFSAAVHGRTRRQLLKRSDWYYSKLDGPAYLSNFVLGMKIEAWNLIGQPFSFFFI
jgi:hypothetical protein